MPTLAYGDAIGNDAFELQRLFWQRGVQSDIFVDEAKPEVLAFARSWRDLRPKRLGAGGLLLVHVSMGNDQIDEVAKLPVRKAVIYHNITPARYFSGVNPAAEKYSAIGRRQLKDLAAQAELGIADSEFNRRELEEMGYKQTAVVPIIVDWSAFDVEPDPAVMRTLSEERTSIITVGQLLPHKGIHDVITAFARYRERDRGARLYLVGSTAMSAQYIDRLRADVQRLRLADAVTFTGSVPIESLVAYYRGATALRHALGARGLLRAAARGDAQRPADRRQRRGRDPRHARRRRHPPEGRVARGRGGGARAGRRGPGAAQGASSPRGALGSRSSRPSASPSVCATRSRSRAGTFPSAARERSWSSRATSAAGSTTTRSRSPTACERPVTT